MKKTKVKQSDNQVDELKNQLARALADYDNLQKRIEREKDTIRELISAQLLSRLLPVFDMFEQVQSNINDPGLAIALGELEDQLKQEGFVKILPKSGDKFNEQEHEAVESVQDKTKDTGEIVSISSAGWKLETGFIIRPAKVIVVK